MAKRPASFDITILLNYVLIKLPSGAKFIYKKLLGSVDYTNNITYYVMLVSILKKTHSSCINNKLYVTVLESSATVQLIFIQKLLYLLCMT